MTLLESVDTVHSQPNGLTSPWTSDRIADVERLWRSGKTATEISREVGITRNSVLGKLHRLKLKAQSREPGAVVSVPQRGRRPDGFRRNALPKDPTISRSRAACYVSVLDEPKVDPNAPSPHACALVELTDENCHFPIGEPGKSGFHFCGGRAPGESPYCGPHSRIAYRT